jgi:hypothetical protein
VTVGQTSDLGPTVDCFLPSGTTEIFPTYTAVGRDFAFLAVGDVDQRKSKIGVLDMQRDGASNTECVVVRMRGHEQERWHSSERTSSPSGSVELGVSVAAVSRPRLSVAHVFGWRRGAGWR